MANQVETAAETSPLIIEDSPPSKACNLKEWGAGIWHVIREEFRCRCFGFGFPHIDVFYTAQWRSPRVIFLIYRLVLAIYVVTFIMLSLTILPKNSPDRPWPVFMTNWGYFILTCHVLLAAINAVIHFRSPSNDHGLTANGDDEETSEKATLCGCKTPWELQLDWLIYCVAVPTAMSITLRYNTHGIGHHVYNFKDVNNHVINGVIAFIDICVCAIPVRLLHFVYGSIFFGIYFLFSYVFYRMDPTNNVLYPTNIDWRCPKETMISYAHQGVLYPILLQIFLFIVYRLKVFICQKCIKSSP